MIGERTVEGLRALTLESEDAGIEAAFVPSAGMVGCSLHHRGEELLGQRDGLRSYAVEGGTMGIPLLYPWANRLSDMRFDAAGKEVVLDRDFSRLGFDPNGLPIHGLLAAVSGWEVSRHEAEGDGGLLEARFDFAANDELMAMFPFSHELTLRARLDGSKLAIAALVRATGDDAVPISFGFHPYFRLPGIERGDWQIEVPVSVRVELDDLMLPTGRLEEVDVEGGALRSRTFDDAYTAPRNSKPFLLAGGGRRIEVGFDSGYPFAQVYAPSDDDVVAYEPMTAPTNALVTGGAELPVVPPGETYEASFSITVN